MTESSPVELSIVVPAYNEAKRLPTSLHRIHQYVEQRWPGRAEVIVVDDGSSDGTEVLVKKLNREDNYAELRYVTNGVNHGKGYSVRHGMQEARGRLALFTDADLSAPIEEADKLIAALDHADAAIGSRALDRSLIEIHQSKLRELAGMTFNLFVRLFTGVRFKDTQCGFKAFRRERASIIFRQQRIEGFGFDPELLFLAKRHGLNTVEIPVRWAHDPGTKVHVVRDSLRMLRDLVRIRWNWLLGRYPRESGG